MGATCTSFPPIVSPQSRVLVLGSMPGVASLAAQQYYAHPRNAFWPVLYALWGAGRPDSLYADKVSFVQTHHLAVWDVAMHCERDGSSDASIREVVPNDFGWFFTQYPNIHTICFNGRLAQALFEKHALPLAGGRALHSLPSTSPAYTIPFDEKLAAWQIVREAAKQEKCP